MTDTIRLGLYVYPPDVEECVLDTGSLSPSVDCKEPGLVSRFLSTTLEYAGLDYELTSVSNELGYLAHNSTQWTGLFGELQRNEIDMISTFAFFTQLRFEYFDYTRFFDTANYVFVIKKDSIKLSQGAQILIQGFSFDVWMTALATLIILLCSFVMTKWMWDMNSRAHYHCTWRDHGYHLFDIASNIVWRATRFSLQQFNTASDFRRTSLSFNTIFVLFSFFTVILISLYHDVIYSQVLELAESAPFQSTQELVQMISSGRLTLITSAPDMAYFDGVNHSNSPHFKMVRKALEKNPLHKVDSSMEAARLLSSDSRYVYVSLKYAAMRMAQNNCDLVIVDVDTPNMWMGYILNKNSSDQFRYRLDKATTFVRGRLDYLKDEMMDRYMSARKCSNKHGVTPLSLATLSGVFILYLVFAAFSISSFFMEQLFACLSRVRGVTLNKRTSRKEREEK